MRGRPSSLDLEGVEVFVKYAGWRRVEKVARRLFKKFQMQGRRNPEE